MIWTSKFLLSEAKNHNNCSKIGFLYWIFSKHGRCNAHITLYWYHLTKVINQHIWCCCQQRIYKKTFFIFFNAFIYHRSSPSFDAFPAGTQRPGDFPWRSPKCPNVCDLQGTFGGLSGDQQKNWWFDEKSVF